MISTELLLYLVTSAFIIFVLMNYYRAEKFGTVKYDMPDQTVQPVAQQPCQPYVPQCPAYPPQPYCAKQGRSPRNINVNVTNEEHGHHMHGMHGMHGMPDPLRKFDYDAVYDEFTPPFRRSYFDYEYVTPPGLAPIYSRGPPGRFRKVGILIEQNLANTERFKFLNLIGREKYPGRDYEYFATTLNYQERVKFYIDTRGKEIADGDPVTIAELDGYSYVFKEDKDLSPRYDPFLA